MIIINDNVKNKIKDWDLDSVYILADFDRTITAGTCDSTWGLLSKSGLVSKEYAEERQKLFEYYRPIEIDASIDLDTKNKLMIDWWDKHISLFIKYHLEEKVINEASNDSKVLKFREGAKEFLEKMRDNKVPLIIISAGIGNFIKQFLINNNCDFENIYIFSNFIKFENGVATGIEGDVIHSLNKNLIEFPEELKKKLKNRKNIVLLGDSIADIRMAKEKEIESALKIGFLEEKIELNKIHFENNFDVVCVGNTSFDELKKELDILKKI